MTVITPPRAQRSPLRLVAGLLWLVAAGLGIGSTFGDVLHRTHDGGYRVETGYWELRVAPTSGEIQTQTQYYGVPVILAAVLLVLAFLIALLTARRWAAIVAGAVGTGIILDSALTWYLGLLGVGSADEARSQVEVKAGLILVTAATVVALFALLLASLERTRPVQVPPPHYAPPPMRPPYPPQPPQPPRWEPETPSYGVPVQTESGSEQPETPSYGTPAQPENATAQPDTPSDTTTSIESPSAPEPGSISRKLDGDEK